MWAEKSHDLITARACISPERDSYEYTPQKEKIPGRGEGLGSLSSAKLLEFKQKIPTAKATVGMIKSDCTSWRYLVNLCRSVGCLTHKAELFRLRFVLFATVRSTNFSLFPSSPARFFRILGQNWVKRSPAEYRWPPEQNWFTIGRGSPGRKLFGLFSYSPKLRLSCSQVLWYNLNTKIEQQIWIY